MSITIIGGNECMVNNYKQLCKKYKCKAKIFTQPSGSLRKQIGSPDILILFTSTVSHKMIHCALSAVNGTCAQVVRSHSSSMTALKEILEEQTSVSV